MSFPGVHAVFPRVPPRAGMYESFYLRAVSPREPVGVWIRYTVHKPPGQPPRGSLWCTVFDASRGRPFMHKLTTEALAVPPGGWIAVGDAHLGPGRAEGACGPARWSLRVVSPEPELRHLPRHWMYRAPLPRTKLTSPSPAACFQGTIVLSSSPAPHRSSPPTPARTIELDGWRGMIGHNWGTEHAERWIWLHGIDFHEPAGSSPGAPRDLDEAPRGTGDVQGPRDAPAWVDVAIGRLRIAGRTTPWVANGALSLDGERPERCRLSLPGARGLMVEGYVRTPPETHAGWRYADPDAHPDPDPNANAEPDRSQIGSSQVGRHDVSNCSIASLTLVVRRPGLPARTLRTPHGAAYELGMRERDHDIPIAPFPDD
jgi:hypothetical protein